jgi:hypothetical protein
MNTPSKTYSIRRAGPPTIWLLIDGSGSMAEALQPSQTTRWDALRAALFGSGGIVPELENDVRWGMMIFDGTLPGGMPSLLPDGGPASGVPPAECFRLTRSEPKLGNAASLMQQYAALAPGGSTPTHYAFQELLKATSASAAAAGDVASGDIIVLASDGAPNDFCAMNPLDTASTNEPASRVVELVRALSAKGTQTYVISLAAGDQVLQAHLEEVARAGDTGRPPMLATSPAQLLEGLRAVRAPALGCEFWLDGKVALDKQCQIAVAMDGKRLSCSGTEGFTFADASTLRLTGAACDAYRASAQAQVNLDFPCDVFVPNP